MSLTNTERSILDNIGKDAREARDSSIRTETTVVAHTEQITELFTQGRMHADAISVLKTQHAMCDKNNDQGNKAERKGNRLAMAAIVVSGAIGALGFVLSLVISIRTFLS